jgi:hypothetical protein
MLSKAGIQLLGEIWDRFGLATILVGVALATWFGWISSPFSEAQAIMERHVATMEAHVDHDGEILFYLKTQCQITAMVAKTDVALCNWDPRDR